MTIDLAFSAFSSFAADVIYKNQAYMSAINAKTQAYGKKNDAYHIITSISLSDHIILPGRLSLTALSQSSFQQKIVEHAQIAVDFCTIRKDAGRIDIFFVFIFFLFHFILAHFHLKNKDLYPFLMASVQIIFF